MHLEYPEKTIDPPQVTDKLYHIMSYWENLAWAGFELVKLVVIGTDCIGSYKPSYHTITTVPALIYIDEIITLIWNEPVFVMNIVCSSQLIFWPYPNCHESKRRNKYPQENVDTERKQNCNRLSTTTSLFHKKRYQK